MPALGHPLATQCSACPYPAAARVPPPLPSSAHTARRGFEPAPSIASAGIQSTCEERFFLFFFLLLREDGHRGAMTTRWQSYLCPGLLSSAFRRFPAAMFSYVQFAIHPRVSGSAELQKCAMLVGRDHVFSPPWAMACPEAFPDLTFRPGTSQGSGRSSRWQRGCRFPRAGRAWTRRDCPLAHSAHQKTARDRCRCNLERVKECHKETISV